MPLLSLPSSSRTSFRSKAVAACVVFSTFLLSACGGGSDATDAPVAATPAATASVVARTKYSKVASFDTTSATKIADENGTFTLTAPALVFFGANGQFDSMQLAAGNYVANTTLFGDPAPYVFKAAYVVDTSAIATFDASRAILIAGENQSFTLATSSIVFYGANGHYTAQQLAAGTYTAGNALFGDPASGSYKSAYVMSTTAIIPFNASTATKIADENGQFTLTAAATVYYGANGSFATRQLAAGTYYASNAIFGDPASGMHKAAYVMDATAISQFDVTSATKVADEYGSFTLTSPGTVYFGAAGSYASKQLAVGTYQAMTSLFGDPKPGVFKAAYVLDSTLVTPFNPATATKVAGENAPFYLSSTSRVYFGANASFTSMLLAAGTYVANTAQFGDPAPGYSKSAYVTTTTATPQFDASTASRIADENHQFTLDYASVVFFGSGSTFSSRLLAAGTYTANTSIFADLSPGTSKAAYVLSVDVGPKASAPPTIVAQPNSVVVGGGQPATFSVSATSDAVVTYQWTRNGSAIQGATASSLTLASVQLTDTSAKFAVTVSNNAGATQSTTATLTVNAQATQSATAARPFSDQSPWNSHPTQVTLGSFQIPASYYYPTVTEGPYSVGAFAASASDPAVSVMGPSGSSGIYVADAETTVAQITIPHWPANVTPASGGDGHADIIDVANNKIHSFYQLVKDSNNQWRATQYTWTALNGRGFATPAAYMQGSRATGVVPIAGLIRTAELTDGLPTYKHALAMSLATTGLSASPTYTFPATVSDIYASNNNTGGIPEGALLMLPATFDLTKIKDARLLKIARTLQTYGGYAVDTNSGTPYVIYVELGSGFNLMPNGWDGEIATELDLIRSSLRQAVSTSSWVDANGASFTPETNLNMLSMRGSWYLLAGSTAGTFDTWSQAVTFANNGQFTQQINGTGRSMPPSLWGSPVAGKAYRLAVTASGGATLQFTLVDGTGQPLHATAELADGNVHIFTWPTATTVTPWVRVSSGPNGGGTVSATLTVQ